MLELSTAHGHASLNLGGSGSFEKGGCVSPCGIGAEALGIHGGHCSWRQLHIRRDTLLVDVCACWCLGTHTHTETHIVGSVKRVIREAPYVLL